MNVHSHTYTLLAGDTDAEGRLPLTLLTEQIIEVASEHANALGIGYATLIEHDLGWVLSRVAIEMTRYPGINESYTITTWIESYNRRFSERNFCFTAADGTVIGYARTIWVAMNYSTRTAADLEILGPEHFLTAPERECPIARSTRIAVPALDARSAHYTFGYCDLDFNRHVNTVRYIALILNQWPLEFYDSHIIRRFDIQFHNECYYGSTVELLSTPAADGHAVCAIVTPAPAVVAAISF